MPYYSGTPLDTLGVDYMLVTTCIALIYVVGTVAIIGSILLGTAKNPTFGALLILAAGILSLIGSFIPVIDKVVNIGGSDYSIKMVLIETLNFLGPQVIGEPSGLLLIAGVLGLLLALKKE
ncbi:MAG: hypothetical protein Q6373_003210 [Candidatus Sigynarchaeota archaeon]